MSWDYAHALNSLDLSDVATFATIEDETPSPFNDFGIQIPGRDGVQFDPEAPFSPLVVTLRVHLRWTSAAGTVTHVDGEGGHIRENLSLIKRELNKPAPVLTRTIEHVGAVRAVVKMNAPAIVGAQRHAYVFPLTVPSGSWQDAATTNQAAGSLSTSGDRRIHDPVLSVGAAGTLIYAATDTTYTITAASGPTYPVTIDVGAGTVTATGGADARGDVTFSDNRWMVFDPNSTTAITGTAAASSSATYRNRWA